MRTSAEEAARKKEEQRQKAKAYQAAMTRILAKKELEEYDDEMMQLVGGILTRNPDVATLWNIRRLCLLKLKEDENADVQAIFDKDLGFTEHCLQANPKSYCAWHQRCWILENSPTPNWQREVLLCTKYLKMDERNCMPSHTLHFCQNFYIFPFFFLSSRVGLSALCMRQSKSVAGE